MTLQIRRLLAPESKYAIKCPYKMTAQGITYHNTYNDAPAINEVSYMINNNNYTSFHFAVDDVEAVQGIPLDRNAFHASDGATGFGNRNTIAIENCYSKSGGERFIQAEKNGAKLVAYLCKERGWGIDKVKRHYDYAPDKKYCPHRTMDMGWQRFLNMVANEMGIQNVVDVPDVPKETPSTPSGGNVKVGDTLTINGVYASSTSSSKLKPAKTSGVVTKIINCKRNPYLLDNGNLGWVNDDCITNKKAPTPTPTPPTTNKPDQILKAGEKAIFSGVYPVEQLKKINGVWSVYSSKIGAYINVAIVTETDANGNPTSDQFFDGRASYFKVPGTFIVESSGNGTFSNGWVILKGWGFKINPLALTEV